MPKQHTDEATVTVTTGSVVRFLCVLAAAFVLWRLIDLVMLVVIAFVIASAILPLAVRLEKRGVPRVWTVFGVFAVILTGIGVLSVLTAPAIGDQLTRLMVHAPDQISRASAWLTGRLSGLAGHPVRTPEITTQIAQALQVAAGQTL